MPPKKQNENKTEYGESTEDEFASTAPRISFTDLEKSMTSFNGDDAYGIETWIKEFEDIATLMEWNNLEKLVYSKRLLSGTARLFLRSLQGVTKWESLKTELREEFGSNLNSAALHKRLASRKMKNTETYQQYFLHMKEIALLGTVEDEALMEYVIDGIRDTESNKSILYGATNMKEFRKKLELYSEIRRKTDTKTHHSYSKPPATPSTSKTQRQKPKTRCYNCGDTEHFSNNCTKGIKCFKCNNFGHKSSECRNKEKQQLKIQEKGRNDCCTPYKDVYINETLVKALIDTGSDVNLIKESYLYKINSEDYNQDVTMCLKGIADHEIQTRGSILAKIQIDNCYFDATIHVVQDEDIPVDFILGNPILNDVEVNFTAEGITTKRVMHLTCIEDFEEQEFAEEIKTLIQDYNPTNPQKESNVELKIILNDETPIHQNPRRLSPLELDVVNKQIIEWSDAGIIVPSKSDFSSPVVLAKKKNGLYRLCIDYRRLNKNIIKERFPLPLIEDQIDRLKHARYFTSLDLENGFLHVNVHKDSRKYTSFVTPQAQYEFTKMPFGLCTAPSVFQRFINDVFQDFIMDGTALAYLDDLIIPSKTEEDGLDKLRKVLIRAEEYGLRFNWKKCQFMKKEITYLGYIINEGEIRPSKEKIAAVSRFPIPQDIKALQSFLGLTGYFRKFIRNYSLIAKPLTDLLKKGVIYDFTLACEQAFEELKSTLCQSPVLKIYDSNLETELHTDASIEGYGAVLLQRNDKDNKMHPVYFMSKKTTPAERKYHSYHLEILAIVEAIRKFRVYLLGIRFKIVTDCSALTMTLKKKDLPPRVARWALILEEYDYMIEHRPGTRMKHADALSRYPIKNVCVLTDTASRLRRAQDDDLKIKLIKKVLENEPYEDYIIENGIVCKVKDGNKLIVVPKKMQNEIIRKNHEKGHFGMVKTEELILREYYIDHLKEKIKTMIDNCVECILLTHKRGKKEGYLQPIDKGVTPLSTYHIDHLGPLTSTHKNYKYLLAIVDGFTKFTWIYPTKTLSSDEVIDKLKIQQQVFGSPERIISDRNASFTSNMFKDYCKDEDITHHVITTGVPRGNGQVERIHQVIINVLGKLSADDPTKWYRRISELQRCLNNTYQRSIGMSPFELLTGVKMRDRNDDILKLIQDEHIENFNNERDELRRKAKESIQKIQNENRRSYNSKRKEAIEYGIGDLVAIKRTQFVQGHKLHPKYLGPYEVVKVKRNNRYDLKKVGTGEGPNNTSSSADLMKPWVAYEDSSHSSETDE